MKYVIKGIKPHIMYSGEKIIEFLREAGVEIEPELRKYDWSKTLDDVLTESEHSPGIFVLKKQIPFLNSIPCEGRVVAGIWQPNIHGKCPVDPGASVLQLRHPDGVESEIAASRLCDVDWSRRMVPSAILAWRFICLAEGYEW